MSESPKFTFEWEDKTFPEDSEGVPCAFRIDADCAIALKPKLDAFIESLSFNKTTSSLEAPQENTL